MSDTFKGLVGRRLKLFEIHQLELAGKWQEAAQAWLDLSKDEEHGLGRYDAVESEVCTMIHEHHSRKIAA